MTLWNFALRRTAALPLAGAVVAVGVMGWGEATAAELKTIKFGMTPKSFIENAQVVADQQGFFEKNGLKVELVELRGDVIILRALLSGDIQIATIGSFAIINAVEKGADIRAFLSTVPEQPHLLIARKEVKDWKDLPGKNFAISEPGAISQTFPRVIMTRLGVDPDKVNYLAIGGNPAREKALLTGTVDATLLHKERALHVARTNDKFHVVGSTADHLPGVPLVMHAARKDWIAANEDVVHRYTKAIIQAVRFSVENKPAMLKLGTELMGLDAASMEQAYEEYRKSKVWGVNGGLDKKGFDFTVKLGIETGELKTPVTYEKAVDPRFVEAAVKALGMAKN